MMGGWSLVPAILVDHFLPHIRPAGIYLETKNSAVMVNGIFSPEFQLRKPARHLSV